MAIRTPYPIEGLIYDTDGSTALSGVTVRVYDTNLDESIYTTTDAAGEFILDLANLTSEYSNGNKLQLVAYTTNKSCWYRHTVDTVVGRWDVGSKSLHTGRHHIAKKTRLNAFVVTNHSASAGQVDFYEVDTDDKLLSVECAANATESAYLAHGLVFEGGICVIRETDTAATWEVALVAGG